MGSCQQAPATEASPNPHPKQLACTVRPIENTSTEHWPAARQSCVPQQLGDALGPCGNRPHSPNVQHGALSLRFSIKARLPRVQGSSWWAHQTGHSAHQESDEGMSTFSHRGAWQKPSTPDFARHHDKSSPPMNLGKFWVRSFFAPSSGLCHGCTVCRGALSAS